MRKVSAALGAALVVISLAGCASQGSATDAGAAAVEPTAAPVTMAPEPSPEATASAYGDYTQDEFFVAGIQSAWRGTPPDDASLVGAAKLACDQLAAGTAESDVLVVEGDGEDAAWNNERTVQYSIQVYCPEFAS